uniref:C2H2-type domain-containing protein n=1 Tax=Anopheles minimus TaxID=112268 RepID=A0A182VUC9_9DIPT
MEYNNAYNKPYCGVISQPIPPPGSSGYFPANDAAPTFLKVPNPPYIKQESGSVGGDTFVLGGSETPPVNYSQNHHYGTEYGESVTGEKSLFYRKPFEMPYLSNPYIQPHPQQFAQHPLPHLASHPNHHTVTHLQHQQQQQLPPTTPTVPSDMHSPQQLAPEHMQRPPHPQSFHEYFDHSDHSSIEPYAYVLQKPTVPTLTAETPPFSATEARSPYEHDQQPPEPVSFKCENCPKMFNTQAKLEKHGKTHVSNDGRRDFKCRMCEKAFRTRSTLICHEKVHGENGVFCYKASHKEHMFKVHFPRPKKEQKREQASEEGTGDVGDGGGAGASSSTANGNQGRNKFKCNVCDRRFYYKRALEVHMGVHDASLDVNLLYFSCNYCPDTFTEEETLHKHEAKHVAAGTIDFLQNMRALEQSENPANGQVDGGFRCPLCFKRFEDQPTLRDHHKTHLCSNPDCTKCEAARGAEFDLSRSTYNANDDMRETVCNVCHRQLPTFEQFQNHFHYHTSRVPFYCYHCREEFTDKRELYNHSRTHTPREPESYTCEVCAKVFSTKGNFKRHLKSHEAVRAFACDRCSKQYDYKSALEVHLKRSHGIEL